METNKKHICTLGVQEEMPLYHPVESLEIGLDEGATLIPVPPLKDSTRYIAVYGSSITQGAFASRPGMSYTNILSRRLSRHFYNFGFSGAGLGEPVVAKVLGALPSPSMYLLDYEPNAGRDGVIRTLRPFIKELRLQHKFVPILVMSKYRFLFTSKYSSGEYKKIVQKHICNIRNVLDSLDDPQIYFYDGTQILGNDWEECLADNVHTMDLGFYRMADALAPYIKDILEKQIFKKNELKINTTG